MLRHRQAIGDGTPRIFIFILFIILEMFRVLYIAVPVEESVVIFVRGVCKYDRNGLATTKYKTVFEF